MKSKIDTAIEALKSRGHTVQTHNREGKSWYEIDGGMLASQQEMEDLADRVNWLLELNDVFGQRPKEEQEN
jgi:hypothetical protein